MVPTRFKALLELLVRSKVNFVLIGGLAAVARGSARVTVDLDVVYDRSMDNVRRLVSALAPIHPYLRGAPPNLPFKFDELTIARGLNFTLNTDWGDIDLLGEVTGGGTYPQLIPHSTLVTLYETQFQCVDLDTLIHLKRSAGRTKDFEAIAELETLRLQLRQNERKE